MINAVSLKATGRVAFFLVILLGCLVACANAGQFVLKDEGGRYVLLGGGGIAPLAQFESAATYDFYLANHNGRQSLVRESYGASKSTVVVFLDGDATYAKAVYFSIDMIASGGTGNAQWAAIEIQFENPRLVSAYMWDELLSEFEKYSPGYEWRGRYRGPGAVIPTSVYKSGKKLGEVAYISPSHEISRIEIESLKRIGDF